MKMIRNTVSTVFGSLQTSANATTGPAGVVVYFRFGMAIELQMASRCQAHWWNLSLTSNKIIETIKQTVFDIN